MSAARVCGLYNESRQPRIESIIICQSLQGHDWVRQVLVEIAGLDKAYVWQEVLVQHIVVVRVLGLEVGVADAHRGGRGAGINLAGRRTDVLGIRASQAPSVHQPQVGILIQADAKRSARQDIQVVSARLDGQAGRRRVAFWS
jgi:hypothetical protein